MTEWAKGSKHLTFGVTFLGSGSELADQNPGLQSCPANSTSSNDMPLPMVLQIACLQMGKVIQAVSALHVKEIP